MSFSQWVEKEVEANGKGFFIGFGIKVVSLLLVLLGDGSSERSAY